MGKPWDAAVAAAEEGPPADLAAAVAEELIALWSDLAEALRRAGRRSWSAECDGLVVRIVMLSRLTTATPWPWIPASLLADGTYQGVMESAAIAVTAPDAAGIRRVRAGPGARPDSAVIPSSHCAKQPAGRPAEPGTSPAAAV
jgi:hypothetical protein